MAAFLPVRCRGYLEARGIAFEEIEDRGQKGLILRQMVLPAGKYSVQQADVLMLIPPGYPDVAPDMFYTLPWLQLAPNNGFPRCADVPQDFAGQRWQRWSRHSDQWRPGRDGIWTMIKRFEHAVEIAA